MKHLEVVFLKYIDIVYLHPMDNPMVQDIQECPMVQEYAGFPMVCSGSADRVGFWRPEFKSLEAMGAYWGCGICKPTPYIVNLL